MDSLVSASGDYILMQFTGNSLTLTRSIYTQTGNFGFNVNCSVDNTTGRYQMGLSGAQGTLEFRLESGRMYYQDQFIHTYRSFQPFIVEAQFTTGTANVVKDGSALLYGRPKATGNYDTFYMKRDNARMGADFDLSISGDNAPLYSISTLGYLTASGQGGVTGYFVNQSAFPLRVFNASIQATESYVFGKLSRTLGNGATGIFTYSGDFSSFDLTQPVLTTFNTSYGDTSVLFTIIDATTLARFVYLTGPTDFTFNSTGILNRDLTYINYSGGVATDAFSSNLVFRLDYSSGSGTFAGPLTGFSTPGTGRFLESGLLTGSFQSSGVSQFSWATGAATGFFSGVGTGIASGIGYTGLATGYMTGLATGFIFDGSGTLTTDPHIGGGLVSRALTRTGVTFATGYIDLSTLIDGDEFEIVYPNGTDYTFEPIAFLNCAYLPSDPPLCVLVGPGSPSVSFTNGTDLIQCISGYSTININGVVETVPPVGPGPSTEIVRFTALSAGSNGIAITGITPTIQMPGSGYLTGGDDGSIPTFPVYPMGSYSGSFPVTITGTGLYNGAITGQVPTYYTKTFTGSWDLMTGVDSNTLVSLNRPSNRTATTISASGLFAPNSTVTFQVTHNLIDSNLDRAVLTVSGSEVSNPINQILTN